MRLRCVVVRSSANSYSFAPAAALFSWLSCQVLAFSSTFSTSRAFRSLGAATLWLIPPRPRTRSSSCSSFTHFSTRQKNNCRPMSTNYRRDEALQYNETLTTPNKNKTATVKMPDPLYITIGPPCAGKSTWVASQQHASSSIMDICLDDQPGVYHSLPRRFFLGEELSNNKDRRLLQQTILGKTVSERIHAPNQVELRTVLGRLAGKLTTDQMQIALTAAVPNRTELVSTYLNVVEEAIQAETEATILKELPETVDLFVQEAIYRPYNGSSGLDRCQAALTQLAPQPGALAFGNTNTRPSDYKMALEAAATSGRPVHFVVYKDDHTPTTTAVSREEPDNVYEVFEEDVFSNSHSLLAANLEELLRRNIHRLLQTGRYIPCSVIAAMRVRTTDSVRRVIEAWKQQQSRSDNPSKQKMSKLKFDQLLAGMIHFKMHANRTVSFAYANADNKRNRSESRNFSPRNVNHRRRPWERMGSRDHDHSGGRPDGRYSGWNYHQRQQQRRFNGTTTPVAPRDGGGVREGGSVGSRNVIYYKSANEQTDRQQTRRPHAEGHARHGPTSNR